MKEWSKDAVICRFVGPGDDPALTRFSSIRFICRGQNIRQNPLSLHRGIRPPWPLPRPPVFEERHHWKGQQAGLVRPDVRMTCDAQTPCLSYIPNSEASNQVPGSACRSVSRYMQQLGGCPTPARDSVSTRLSKCPCSFFYAALLLRPSQILLTGCIGVDEAYSLFCAVPCCRMLLTSSNSTLAIYLG